MKILSSLRSKFLAAALVSSGLVLLAISIALWGQRANDEAGEKSLRYANQAMLLQMLVKDINQLVMTEGSKVVRARLAETVKNFDATLGLESAPGESSESETERQKRLASWKELKSAVEALVATPAISAENDEILIKVVKLVARLDGLADEIHSLAKKAHADGSSLAEQTLFEVGAIFALLLAVIVALFFYLYKSLYRDLGAEPGEAAALARQIAEGELDVSIHLRPEDSTSVMAEMAKMRDRLAANLESIQRAAEENLRVRMALDNVSTGVMIADADRHIIYANRSAQNLARAVERELRHQKPDFSADHLLGTQIEILHSNPAAHARLLGGLTQSHQEELAIGDRYLTMTANPVVSPEGERLGSVVEWTDRTSEIVVEREVADIVTAAALGDLGKRVPQEGKQGFFATLTQGLNQLLDNTGEVLDATSVALEGLASGDLTRKIEGNHAGIFRRLQDETNATIDRLREVVTSIKEAAAAISAASSHIAAGNQDLSARTEAQASTLNQTTSSMNAFSINVRKNAENASRANDLMKESNEIASRGGEMVHRVVTTMEEIHGSSKRISDIVGLIDSISFQTNILALNAAVEAARAGEQGRGFAVVASEVRSLSQRSAAAAREIKTLIDDSVDKVEAGSTLVAEAGQTMVKVVESFHQVTDLMTAIADASREQSAGIEQVTWAVQEMDKSTASNAALVEEAAAAAASLEQQAGQLVKAVDMFKLETSSSSRTYANAVPATKKRLLANAGN